MIFALLIFYGSIAVWAEMRLSDRLKLAERRVDDAQRDVHELKERVFELETQAQNLADQLRAVSSP